MKYYCVFVIDNEKKEETKPEETKPVETAPDEEKPSESNTGTSEKTDSYNDSSDDDGSNTQSTRTTVNSSTPATEEGSWTSTTNANGDVIWNCLQNGKPITDRWAYLKISNDPQAAGGWFFFDPEGKMKDGWFTDKDGKIYFLQTSAAGIKGMMATGWQLIDGKYYYFNNANGGTIGALLTDTITLDGYRVGKDGAWIES